MLLTESTRRIVCNSASLFRACETSAFALLGVRKIQTSLTIATKMVTVLRLVSDPKLPIAAALASETHGRPTCISERRRF